MKTATGCHCCLPELWRSKAERCESRTRRRRVRHRISTPSRNSVARAGTRTGSRCRVPSAPTTVQTSSIAQPDKTLSRRRTSSPSLSLARERPVAPTSRRDQLARSRGSRHEGVAIRVATTRRNPEAKGQRSSQPSQSATASRVRRGGKATKNKKLLQTQPAGVIGLRVGRRFWANSTARRRNLTTS